MAIELVTNKVELVKLFHRLELSEGDNVMVHFSMISLGVWVIGAVDVAEALIECIGLDKDTILMPVHSGQ